MRKLNQSQREYLSACAAMIAGNNGNITLKGIEGTLEEFFEGMMLRHQDAEKRLTGTIDLRKKVDNGCDQDIDEECQLSKEELKLMVEGVKEAIDAIKKHRETPYNELASELEKAQRIAEVIKTLKASGIEDENKLIQMAYKVCRPK